MSDRLVILGAGGHGRVIADAAVACCRWGSVAFLDDRYPKLDLVDGHPVLGGISEVNQCFGDGVSFIVGIGNNELRYRLTRELVQKGMPLASVQHPSAVISPLASVGGGAFVAAGAILNPGTRAGAATIINTGAIIDHDCLIGDGTHVCPGAMIAGGVRVGVRCWIGIGSVLIQQVNVGDACTVGAGAIVVRDLLPGLTYVGSPARPLPVRFVESQ